MADFHQVPKWLDQNYVENILRIYNKDISLKINEIDISPATNKGENYASVMFRVRVKYFCRDSKVSNTKNYILKMSFEDNDFVNDKLLQFDVFRKELEIYDQIFPKFNSLFKKLGESIEIYPESIYVDYNHDLIVFEDLAVRKFVLADRRTGLDMVHSKMVLRKLAKMHAASAVLNERNPEIFKNYDRGMYNRHTEAFSPYFLTNLEICGKLCKSWKKYEHYSEKIDKLKPMFMEYGKRCFDADSNHLNVLIHGDIWVNNIMFKYNQKEEPVDVILVDFQYSCWTSPAVDLHYFFNTSLREEIRLYNQDELVQYYYYILANTLKDLEFKGKIPTLHEFWVQYTEKCFYAFAAACLVQPVMLNENTVDVDFSSLVGDDERAYQFKRMVYESEKVQTNLRRLLPIFDKMGLLDLND